MNIRTILGAYLLGTLACGTLLAGCDNRQEQAGAAFGRYEAATVAGDLEAARRALLALVAVDDDVASYWTELGRVNLQLDDFGAAYGAFTRAYELDRANPVVLATLTQLALRSGNLERAQEHARQLELVAPGDPAIRLTYGHIALQRGDLVGAGEQAKAILTDTPYDPSAKVLQSRILLQDDKSDEAVALLNEHVRLQPSDPVGLRALLAIYELRERWPEAATAARALHKLQPGDRQTRLRLTTNELRAGQVEAALAHLEGDLVGATARQIDQAMAPWIDTVRQRDAVARVAAQARSAQGDRQVALARFLVAAREPGQVVVLLREQASLPVAVDNLGANAVLGTALAQTGHARQAIERLDAVVRIDPANGDALLARSELRSRQGQHKGAIEDAQRLVAADRNNAAARLALFRAYRAASRRQDARRTLWDAFHDIPANRPVYEVLRVVVQREEGQVAAERLTGEFDDQRHAQLMRIIA